jgi:lysozyme
MFEGYFDSVIDHTLDFLVVSEGIVLEPYQDTVGVWTIGIGSTYNPFTGERVTDSYPGKISKVVAGEWAKETLRQMAFESGLHKLDLQRHEAVAVLHFIYNVGVDAFKKSTMLRRLLEGAKLSAAMEFFYWTRQPELMGRRLREFALFVTGSKFIEVDYKFVDAGNTYAVDYMFVVKEAMRKWRR